MIRIGIVEDHDMVREGLVAVLGADQRIEVHGTAACVEDFRSAAAGWKVDVLLSDYELGDGTGIDVANHAKNLETPPAVLLVSGQNRSRILDEAIEAGCSGVVSKGVNSAELANMICTVSGGATVYSPDVLRSYAKKTKADVGATLTDRERETLQLLADARSAREIATAMFLSTNTVRNHISAVLGKLNARSQLDAVVIALKAGIVTIREDSN